MPRHKNKARRRVYIPLDLDELAYIAGLEPKQKIIMRRYILMKIQGKERENKN